jgi:hypothetical protein
MPRTDSSVSSDDCSGQISPLKPFVTPITRQPFSMIAFLTTARITAFNPGQSPPPLTTPIVRVNPVVIELAPVTTYDFTPVAARFFTLRQGKILLFRGKGLPAAF